VAMNNKLRIKRLLVIPARGNSKRIKNKNIKHFFNKPIIYYILDNAKKSNLFSKIHVSTDSKKIARVVKKKISVDFYRPKFLSTDKVPIIKVLQYVLNKYEDYDLKFDEIWCALPCSPLINVDDLVNISNELIKKKKPLITVSKFPCPIEWALKIKKSKLVPVNKKKLLLNSKYFCNKYFDTGQISAFQITEFKKIKNNHSITSCYPYILPPEKSVDVDDITDWKLSKILYKGLKAI
jgi:N-acylneuraminate cytidylyltransferase